jgi:hypothetical protein
VNQRALIDKILARYAYVVRHISCVCASRKMRWLREGSLFQSLPAVWMDAVMIFSRHSPPSGPHGSRGATFENKEAHSLWSVHLAFRDSFPHLTPSHFNYDFCTSGTQIRRRRVQGTVAKL